MRNRSWERLVEVMRSAHRAPDVRPVASDWSHSVMNAVREAIDVTRALDEACDGRFARRLCGAALVTCLVLQSVTYSFSKGTSTTTEYAVLPTAIDAYFSN